MTAAQPGFWLVARREWRWLAHDPVALTLIFGVPLFAFVILSLAFSHPVIRGLGVAVVDEDRSELSRAFVEQVAASPNLSIVQRTGDLASAARAIRAGDAIAAVYIPANFERDLKAERRPQVIAFYNQQFLTAAGVATTGLTDSLSAATRSVAERAAPKAARIGSLVPESIALVRSFASTPNLGSSVSQRSLKGRFPEPAPVGCCCGRGPPVTFKNVPPLRPVFLPPNTMSGMFC